MNVRHAPALVMVGLIAAGSPAIADEIDDAAADGRSFATEAFPDSTVDADGNIAIGGAGEESDLTPADLFLDADAEPIDAFSAIDSEEEAVEAGQRAREQGSDAIDVLDSTSALEIEEDFSTDPFLDETDRVFGTIDEVADEFGACTTTREALPVEQTAIIPEHRFCERIRKVPGNCTITHDLRIDPATNTVIADNWGPEDCMIAASHAVGPSVCAGEVTLVEGAALGECLEIDGVTICPGDPIYEQLSPPPFDGKEQAVSRLAQTIQIGPLDCEANLSELRCITTSTGEELCPSDQGDIIDTCEGLDADPVCTFVEQGCVDGAEIGGVCFLEEARYTCDQEITFETLQQQTSLSCPDSEIRCAGNDCVEVDDEVNNGVTRGLAALTASQLLAFDSTCDSLDPNSCDVYPGRAQACQRGIGGIFDSCELPVPLGLGPYLDLTFSIGALDTNLTVLQPTSPLRGAWEKLRDPAASAIDALQSPFTSASNSASGSTEPNTNDTIAEEDLAKLRQSLLNDTADDVLERFGAGATNQLFVISGTEGAAVIDADRVGDVALRQPVDDETPHSLVANAYGIGASEAVPAEPAPLVDEDDVVTAAHDDARNCLFVGTQCTPDSFGACISRDHVLCCFNSPLARLAQESAVGQFNRDFGTAELPNCRGLTSGEIQAFDYTALDLDQWIATLGTAQRFPDPEKLTPDGLTGSGNLLGRLSPDELRLDIISRTRLRLDGIDPAAVRRRGRGELETQGQQ